MLNPGLKVACDADVLMATGDRPGLTRVEFVRDRFQNNSHGRPCFRQTELKLIFKPGFKLACNAVAFVANRSGPRFEPRLDACDTRLTRTATIARAECKRNRTQL